MQSPHAILEITIHPHHSFLLKSSPWSESKRIEHISLLEFLICGSFSLFKSGSIFDALWVLLCLDGLFVRIASDGMMDGVGHVHS